MITLRHAENEEEFEDTVVAKAVAMTVLCVVSLTMGLIPLKLTKWFRLDSNPKGNVYVTMLLAMGGGVLLCTTFLHLLPEVAENIEGLQASGELPELPFHLAEFLMCVGFFTMYLVEEIAHRYIHKAHRKSVVEDVLSRTVSVRRKTISGSLSTAELTPDTLEEQRHSNSHVHAEHSHVHAGHSHVMIGDSTVASLRGLLVVLALSIHELFEGLAVGLESSSGTVWYMFGAVACHKFVIAFCIGVELISNGTKTVLVVVYVALFAVVSPLGIGIGIALTESVSANIEVSSVFLQGLASGTLLYVVFFEILQKERTEGLQQYLSILVGFAIMFGLSFICIGIGIALSESGSSSEDVTSTILQGMAAGTLLYVVFFEVLARERGNHHSGIWQLFSILAGFIVMFALQTAIGHEHSHGHGHGHGHSHGHEGEDEHLHEAHAHLHST